MKKALGSVKAKALVMPSATDRVLPVAGAHELRDGIAAAQDKEIPSIFGHMAQNPAETLSREHVFVDQSIARFLKSL